MHTFVECPSCGYAIIDPDPIYCPRCGRQIRPGPAPLSAPEVNPSETVPVLQPEGQGSPQTKAAQIGSRYYLLPLLAIFGGIAGYRAVRKRNARVAATILTISLFVSLIYIGAGFEAYSRISGPPGVYRMEITGVTFPNSTALVVTVSNQGTLIDGLESVAVNNGSLWLVFGLLEASGTTASVGSQGANLTFGLYGYILANGTAVGAGAGSSASVGTERLSPSQSMVITIPYEWTPVTAYVIAITTTSRHPFQYSVVSPA